MTQTEFDALVNQLDIDCRGDSTHSKCYASPTFNQIVDMGEAAIPLILNAMQRKTQLWIMSALNKIKPDVKIIPKEDRGRIQKMNEHWIEWGKQNGYIGMDFSSLQKIELEKARIKHSNMPTLHHAVAVIQEEFEEFKEEVFKQKPDFSNMRKELIQLAAMCQRAAEDLKLLE